MAQFQNQNQYPATTGANYNVPESTAPSYDNTYSAPPPPPGYPTRDDGPAAQLPQNAVPIETKSKGDGFWKGCCAAMCCCCALEVCF